MSAPYVEMIAGTEQLVSTMGIYVSGKGVVEPLTPLMQDATTGALLLWDGEKPGQAVYLSALTVDTALRTVAQVYKCGVFNIDAVKWPESVTTQVAKIGAFVGSGISVQPLSY
ncbi:Bacteriophage lambda head decoration protein D [Serratia plymuthica]|uniref:Head decoration protein n=1 Tax=Serratia plymuthica S13 TaxID=1348660 RepID=S4YSA9_SERPL|nr:head decoration protein [Serratia plymuthica]AGP47396.1 hypothetical protein M621_23080 [Serratia plymuthica S13]KYG15144.1 Bacteriophage lambda head decoration protein D [Serratia plymuthica]QQT84256.1 head decoration protein [Serratia plymuthica]